MQFKKAGKTIFGVSMNAAEKKALNMEIQRQLVEYDRKHAVEIDAVVLLVLRSQLGWGKKRLRRFYDSFSGELNALIDRYQMEECDNVWLCTYKLKELGIDVEQWDKERRDNDKQQAN